MKSTKYFLPVLTSLAVLASCKEADNSELDLSQVKKSVTITIANLADSRAPIDEFTPDEEGVGPLVVDQKDLFAVFADAAGTIVGVPKSLASTNFATGDIELDEEEKVGTYSFHELPSSIMQVAVTNLAVTNGITTLTALKATYDDNIAQGELADSDVPVWDQKSLVLTGTDTHTSGVLEFYTATMTVNALLARIEIGSIQCEDLSATAVEGVYPRYRSLTLEEIGLVYGTAPANAGDLKDVFPDATALASGSNTYMVTKTVDEVPVSKPGVFAYNVVPTPVTNIPGIHLKIKAATRNLPEGTEVAVPAGLLPLYVKTKSLGDEITANGIEPGKIYQINYIFTCADVKGENENPSLICVDVVVTVQNWNVRPVVRPQYQ